MALPRMFPILHTRTLEKNDEFSEEEYADVLTKNIDIHDSSLDKVSSSARKRNITYHWKKSECKYNFLLPWWSLEGSTSQSAVLEPVPAGSSLYHICYAKYSENKRKILNYYLSNNFNKNRANFLILIFW